jgi:hypothetical protein
MTTTQIIPLPRTAAKHVNTEHAVSGRPSTLQPLSCGRWFSTLASRSARSI